MLRKDYVGLILKSTVIIAQDQIQCALHGATWGAEIDCIVRTDFLNCIYDSFQ